MQLESAHRHELERILREADVDFARHRPVVFGSRAHGSARRYSDVDLGMAGAPLPIGHLARVNEALDDSALPYRVDVVNLAETSEEFRALALAGAVPLAGEPVS